jgi:hypothetical protein
MDAAHFPGGFWRLANFPKPIKTKVDRVLTAPPLASVVLGSMRNMHLKQGPCDFTTTLSYGGISKMKISRFTHCFASFTVASGLVLAAGSPGQAQTAGQDIHKAGTSTKNAATETGSAVKKGTTTGYDKTKQGTTKVYDKTKQGTTKGYEKTKEGTTKGYDKTKEGATKGYDKTKQGAQHLTGSKSRTSTKAEDKAKETNQANHDATKEDNQKLNDSNPRP